MTIIEKTDRFTVNTENGICGVHIKYPFFENCKSAKALNNFFKKAVCGYTEYVKKNAQGGEIFSFDTPNIYQNGELCSIFFEKSVKRGRYITSYTPFSLTFSEKNGRPLSLLSVCQSSADSYIKVRKTAEKHGIKLSFSKFSKRFYVSENGIIVYFSVFEHDKGFRKTCECVKKIYLSSGSIPNFSSTDKK